MRRRLGTALVLLGTLWLAPALAWAQTDLSVEQFFLPATSTSGYRVHTSRTHMNVTIPRGNVWAVGGYKTPLQFAHVATASLSNFAIGLGQSGVTAQRLGNEGNVLGLTFASSEVITAGTADANATIRSGGEIRSAGLTLRLEPGGQRSQYGSITQARGLATFTATEEVGCRLTTSATIAPASAQLLCTVIVDF